MHPHENLLKEYQFAIDHLVPTVPAEVKAEGQGLHDALLANENAMEEEILAALEKTGRAEYPHRKAFHDVVGKLEETRKLEMVLEHVDEKVLAKLKKHLDAGVPLEAITNSSIFEEEFTAEERYQVEDALFDAADHLKEEMGKAAHPENEAYKKALAKWEAHAAAIEAKIDELEKLALKDPKWNQEIMGRVERFREGFLVTERDPELEEVTKEIEYWKGVLGEEL